MFSFVVVVVLTSTNLSDQYDSVQSSPVKATRPAAPPRYLLLWGTLTSGWLGDDCLAEPVPKRKEPTRNGSAPKRSASFLGWVLRSPYFPQWLFGGNIGGFTVLAVPERTSTIPLPDPVPPLTGGRLPPPVWLLAERRWYERWGASSPLSAPSGRWILSSRPGVRPTLTPLGGFFGEAYGVPAPMKDTLPQFMAWCQVRSIRTGR